MIDELERCDGRRFLPYFMLLSSIFLERLREASVRIADFSGEIQRRDFPNTKQER
jgi:hypothetical protein